MPITINGDGAISGLGDIDGHDLETNTLVVSGDTTLAPQAVGRASLFVDESTNSVGINTTTPASAVFLEIADATDPIVSLNNTANGTLQLGCNSTRGYIGTSTAHAFRLRSNGTDRVSILSNGDVGINTNTPTATFEVQTGNGERVQIDSIGGSQTPMISLMRDSGVDYNFINDQSVFRIRRNNSAEIYRFSSDSHVFSNVALGVVARLQNTGNFGVGDHTPAYTLDITNRDTTAGYAFRIRTNSTAAKGGIQFTSDASPAALRANVFGNDDRSLSVGTGGSGLERLRIDSTGRVLINTVIARTNFINSSFSARLQVEGTDHNTSAIAMVRNSNNSGGAYFNFAKSRGTDKNSNVIVNTGDLLGVLSFQGSDGTRFVEGASISVTVDGTPGSADMPGRISLRTTSDGNSTTTEKFRVTSDGRVYCGAIAARSSSFVVRPSAEYNGNATSWTICEIAGNSPTTTITTLNGVTSAALPISGQTLTTYRYFRAYQNSLPSGAAITNQEGFVVENNLVSGTNNYGFVSRIPSGTGRWNVYASGTAKNYFAGSVLFNNSNESSITAGTVNGKLISQSAGILYSARDATIENNHVIFVNPNGAIGSITTTGTSTAYNTSSDYRLKENVTSITGAADRVKALKPCRFNFIADATKTVDGFLAHEAQEVVPEAVTGEKDGEEMQAIDTSKLVPLLTAALQEALARIEVLESNQVN